MMNVDVKYKKKYIKTFGWHAPVLAIKIHFTGVASAPYSLLFGC